MTELGIGIIGCGNISLTYLKMIPLFSGMKLRAVADINPEAAQARAAEHGLRAETVEGLLAAEDVAVVVNLTIPEAHYPLTRRILEAGKHAYSEKPLALTLDQAIALRDLAGQRGLRVGSAPDTFLGGAHQLARAMIDEGRVGQVIGGTCHVMSRGMEHWHPNPDFFFQPGGGPVLDLGPYYIANLIQLLGPVRSVAAMTAASFPTRTIGNGPRHGEEIPVDTPTNIHALLEFDTGAIITLGASWDVWTSSHPNMELYGTKGTLQLPDPNYFGGVVRMSEEDGDLTPLAPDDHPFGQLNETRPDGRRQANYRAAGLADMVAAISQNRPHRCGIELAAHTVDVMMAILKAGETRAWVAATTSCPRPAPLPPQAAQALMR
ncbi:Gfo/Idh/MocA family oxidoreductase (plasmid) [Phaeobacter inhibens]|uniref:Gfo/Idh/MocA family protein n=1 Tax=Phaeobacter inhibens TaxID=221822 RepID=UPI0021A78F49|nr:Gfo/Idh/MocA family oxidoreductase [Phaeobacter inhibens]UWR86696.1 Gfo/Idh/MocA family oxidoreductase [Phaeobacter inhibens]